MGDKAKRNAKRRKNDQTSDKDRHARVRAIERNLSRDVKRACEASLKRNGLSLPSWHGNDSQSDTGGQETPL